MFQTAAATRAGDRERHGAAQAQFVGRIVEAGLVGQFEPQNGDAAVGHGGLQLHQIGLLVVAVGALERLDGKILRAQELAAGVADAGRGAQLDGQQARQHGDVDRLREGQGDLVEIGDAVGVIRRAARNRHRQQRNQPRVQSVGLDVDVLQRLPGIRRTKLQRARTEPLPRTRHGRLHGHETLGRILRTAGLRSEIAIEEQRHRIPAAQESFGHDLGAVCALQTVELTVDLVWRLRFGPSHEARRENQRAEKSKALHEERPQRDCGGVRPTISRYCSVTSGGGPEGGGLMPITAGRMVVVRPSAGIRASRR